MSRQWIWTGRLVLIYMLTLIGVPFLIIKISLWVQEKTVEKGREKGQRVALVIGNNAYESKHFKPLHTPVNDADSMAAKLYSCGFSVSKGINLNRQQMINAVREFGDSIKRGGVGLFYYSGHGLQVVERHSTRVKNCLVPVDADLQSGDEVKDKVKIECLSVDSVLTEMDMAGSRLNIVFLEACRDNDFVSRHNLTRGLVDRIEPPNRDEPKWIFGHAAPSGQVVEDRTDSSNSLWTATMLAMMDEPGLEIKEMFRMFVQPKLRYEHNVAEPPFYTTVSYEMIDKFFFTLSSPFYMWLVLLGYFTFALYVFVMHGPINRIRRSKKDVMEVEFIEIPTTNPIDDYLEEINRKSTPLNRIIAAGQCLTTFFQPKEEVDLKQFGFANSFKIQTSHSFDRNNIEIYSNLIPAILLTVLGANNLNQAKLKADDPLWDFFKDYDYPKTSETFPQEEKVSAEEIKNILPILREGWEQAKCKEDELEQAFVKIKEWFFDSHKSPRTRTLPYHLLLLTTKILGIEHNAEIEDHNIWVASSYPIDTIDALYSIHKDEGYKGIMTLTYRTEKDSVKLSLKLTGVHEMKTEDAQKLYEDYRSTKKPMPGTVISILFKLFGLPNDENGYLTIEDTTFTYTSKNDASKSLSLKFENSNIIEIQTFMIQAKAEGSF